MKSVKEAVPQETEAIRRRVLRSLAMGKILREDCDAITTKLDEIEARVATMPERGNENRSF